jgi:hypothetical protein
VPEEREIDRQPENAIRHCSEEAQGRAPTGKESALPGRCAATRGGRRTGVGVVDLIDLIGVEPHFAFAAFEDRRGEALLQLQGHHRSGTGPVPRRTMIREREKAGQS